MLRAKMHCWTRSSATYWMRSVERRRSCREKGRSSKDSTVMGFLAQQISHLSKLLILDLQRRRPDVWARIQKFRKERILEFMGKIIAEGIREGISARTSIRSLLCRHSSDNRGSDQSRNPRRAVVLGEGRDPRDHDLFFLGMLTEEASRDLRTRQSTSSQQ